MAKSTAALCRQIYAAPDRDVFVYGSFATDCEKIVALRQVVLIEHAAVECPEP